MPAQPEGWVFPSSRGGASHVADLHRSHYGIGNAGGTRFWLHGLRNCFISPAERELLLPRSLTKHLVNQSRPGDVAAVMGHAWPKTSSPTVCGTAPGHRRRRWPGFETLDIAVMNVPAPRLGHRVARQRPQGTIERLEPRPPDLGPLARQHGADENAVAAIGPDRACRFGWSRVATATRMGARQWCSERLVTDRLNSPGLDGLE